MACLRLAGVGLETVVATPECVTDCVDVAVRQWARPVPMRVALSHPDEVGVAIVHEQWGWPLPADAQDAVRQRLADLPVVVVVDRVDSADFFAAARTFGTFEILSLSKTLGLPAGGIVRRSQDGVYLRFEPKGLSRPAPSANQPELLSHPAVRERFKQSQHRHPGVLSWLESNCVLSAVEDERRYRNQAATAVLESSLAAGWPGWMAQAVAMGAGPVWVPILREHSSAIHWKALRNLAHTWGITSAVRPFNWSGNPLEPRYEPGVAVPIHGEVKDLTEVISDLGRLIA